ncbi:MAG: carboxynorspermidine decarboxylase [Myxococcota bacterium]|nr:carboxynorspermidine decarboxylase [Myxococcota bacterium]
MVAFPGEACRDLDPREVETPAFVVDLGRLERNLRVLDDVQRRAGCTILLALKGFAMWSVAPLVRRHLAGTAASGPWEARLGREAFGGQVHVYAPAYAPADLDEVLELADHVIFNSLSQWERFRPQVERALQRGRRVSCGLRVNPEHREVEVALYDPCAPGSRLGATRAEIDPARMEGLEGLHVHALCEHGPDALARMLAAFEARFGDLLPRVRWLNLGGGHHITHASYDADALVALLLDLRRRHPHLALFLEPGEAVAIGTGVLVAQVLDVVRNGAVHNAILDVSATCHMPDVLEMPYRPLVRGAGDPGERPHTYRLGGPTCLAGDVIGDYAFDAPLRPGDRIVFEDMAHYTMVKTTTFNGVRHPSIATWDPATRRLHVVRRFRYEDYRDRLS